MAGKLRKEPLKGFRDLLPKQVALRDEIYNLVSEIYKRYGFQRIETPSVEAYENLRGKLGGENEKLVFEIAKRGEAQKRAISSIVDGNASAPVLFDCGLRYDLTMPLSRYIAANAQDLPVPFRSFQFGDVWRADRPQDGRYRQFKQCDIDIVGEASTIAEREVLSAGYEACREVARRFGLPKPYFAINDRRLLVETARVFGFTDTEIPEVLIELDKNDKCGIDGVEKAMLSKWDSNRVGKYCSFYRSVQEQQSAVGYVMALEAAVNDDDPSVFSPLMDTALEIDSFSLLAFDEPETEVVRFDPFLVRGMGYYTGIGYELKIDGYPSSFGGGGRYDGMIGSFSGNPMPACGFSIGFERLASVIEKMEATSASDDGEKSIAYLLGSKLPNQRRLEICGQAQKERSEGKRVVICSMRRNLRKQIEDLTSQGFDRIEKIFE